jgi:hypothetical protein
MMPQQSFAGKQNLQEVGVEATPEFCHETNGDFAVIQLIQPTKWGLSTIRLEM